MTPIRVVLADDHPVLRDGLRAVIDAQPDLTVVGEAGDGPGAVTVARRTRADVVLLDLSMPGGGVAAIGQLAADCPTVRVLVVTMHTDPAYLRAALAVGAAGYMLKTTAVADLLAAVRTVAAGGRVVDANMADHPADPAVGGVVALSRREREVLEQLVHGHTHQAIADRLGVNVKTVETYRSRIREKTGLKSRADLVRYGLEAGLLTADGAGGGAGDRPV